MSKASNSPAVSVCVPIYNAEGFLADTLDSVVGQTFTDWELLLLDDSSGDGSVSVADRYTQDERVVLSRHTVNRGAATTWNRLIEMASGRYVKLLCSDDVLRPNCLEIQVEAMRAHPSAVLAAAKRDIIDDRGRRLIRGRGLGSLRGVVTSEDARQALVRSGTNLFGEPSVVLFRRDALVAAGGFDHRWRYTIDLATYSRVLEHGDLVVTNETLASFRVSRGSWSAALEADQRREHHEFLRQLADATRLGSGHVSARTGRLRASALSVGRATIYRVLRRQ